MSWKSTAACLCAALSTGGCAGALFEPIAVALAGSGSATAIGLSLNGTAYRTFTASLAQVKTASLATLSLMGMRVDGVEITEHGETIAGSATRRSVEIDLERISSNTTRMKVITKNGSIFYDAATATEIVLQTDKALAKD